MYKDTINQLMSDLEDLISDVEADEEGLGFDKQQELLRPLDEAYSLLEDAKRLL
jgi:hypothetical protein